MLHLLLENYNNGPKRRMAYVSPLIPNVLQKALKRNLALAYMA